jgi:hypothetical protein
MENLDFLVMTSVVVLCFVAFFISTFKAFDTAASKNIPVANKRGIISRLLAYFQSLVNSQENNI